MNKVALAILGLKTDVEVTDWMRREDGNGFECTVGDDHILSVYSERIGGKARCLIELKNADGELEDLTGLNEQDDGKKTHEVFMRAKAMSES